MKTRNVRPIRSLGLNESELIYLTIALQSALSLLTERQRGVFMRRHQDGLTQRETAKVLGISHGTVCYNEQQVMIKLRRALP